MKTELKKLQSKALANFVSKKCTAWVVGTVLLCKGIIQPDHWVAITYAFIAAGSAEKLFMKNKDKIDG